MRRLSNVEYLNTVTDLFGGQVAGALTLIPEARVDGFDNNAEGRSVSNTLALQYYTAAEKLAAAAIANLPALLPCDPAAGGDAACLDRFFDGFGKRAWRRPLEAVERDSLKKAFLQGRETSFAEGIAAVIQVMLLSPQFMYRVERGTAAAGADHLRLGGYELASRLSYLLWGSMPDDKLLDAAGAGQAADRGAGSGAGPTHAGQSSVSAGGDAIHRPVAAAGGDPRTGERAPGLHHVQTRTASGPAGRGPGPVRRGDRQGRRQAR